MHASILLPLLILIILQIYVYFCKLVWMTYLTTTLLKSSERVAVHGLYVAASPYL